MHVCYLCFAPSPALKSHFAAGSPGHCDGCNRERKRVIEAVELAEAFRGLTTVYEPAHEGEHFYSVKDEGEYIEGGDSGERLHQLLQWEWPIFREDMDPQLMERILSEAWPGYEGELYAKETLWDRPPDGEWNSIKEHVKHGRRFFPKRRFDFTLLPDLLKPFLKRMTTKQRGGTWYRARIQASLDAMHTSKHMEAPPPDKATAGRANPAGIPYLYLCSDPISACAEIRAEPGHAVTIAEFRIPEKLKLLDVASAVPGVDPFAHDNLKAELQKVSLIRAFAGDLSRPVLAEDAHIDYVPTQYLAEFVMSRGFHGIRYRSSVSEGINLVLFYPEKAKIKRRGTLVVERKKLYVKPPAKGKAFPLRKGRARPSPTSRHE